MRKLASVEKILDIKPIVDADSIEVATVRGWQVVVKKNEFRVGDLVLYIEIDSWVPTTLAPFLTKGIGPNEYNGVKGEKLRTVKMRKQISQGLILPVGVRTPAGLLIKHITSGALHVFQEGDDVSGWIGVQKYEPPIPVCLSGVVRGPWPEMVPHTDQERIQNLVSEYDAYCNMTFEVTEKLEGSSCTMGLFDDEFVVCSRNLNLAETEGNVFWKVARQYKIEEALRLFGRDGMFIQGEVTGEKVQGNYYATVGHQFFVYDIYDSMNGLYLDPESRCQFCNDYSLQHVPVLGTYELSAIVANQGINPIQAILNFADGKSQINENKLREGVVFKRVGGSEHFKAVSNKYLERLGKN